MKKTNTLKPNKTIQQAVELTEAQLNEQVQKAKEVRQKRVADKINELLKAENCTIRTNIDILIGGQPIGISIIAL